MTDMDETDKLNTTESEASEKLNVTNIDETDKLITTNIDETEKFILPDIDETEKFISPDIDETDELNMTDVNASEKLNTMDIEETHKLNMADINASQKLNMIAFDTSRKLKMMAMNTSRKLKIINIDASYKKKSLIFLGIALLSLTSYFSIVRRKSHIQRGIMYTEAPLPPPIGGFYHFAAMAPVWRDIVLEQISLAHLSRLIEASSVIYVTGLGNIEQNKSIYETFTNSKFSYDYNEKLAEYEFPTLKKLERYCLNNSKSFVWYANSKGASYNDHRFAGWRGVMNTFVLDKWRMCYDLLVSTNYTTCGSILTLDSQAKAGWNTYYAGNMWWAKCSHINRLTRIENLNQTNRHIAELYVTSEPAIGHFNCYNTNPHNVSAFDRDTATCSENQSPRTVT